MPANTSPIYTLTPRKSWGKATAADTTQDGTSAGVVSVFTAGANGSYIRSFTFQPISTSGSTTTNTAAGRIYINNGSSIGTATNNVLEFEIQLGATVVNLTATAPAFNIVVPYFIQIPINYVVAFGCTSFASNTQWNCIATGGDY